MPGDADRATPARCAAEALLVLLATLAYLWLFRRYGFDVVDEGTQLAQIDLVVRGARPYVGFETGYTPLYFSLHAALWQWTSGGLLATRTFGVLLHAATIALLYGFTRRFCGAPIALAVSALDLAFLLPVSPRHGAPFNTPYPGWIAAAFALAAQLLVAAVAHARLAVRREDAPSAASSSLAVSFAGLAAGLAFAVKPNAGLLALGGALLALTPSWSAALRLAIVLATLVRVAAVAGTIVLLGPAALDPTYLVALALPVVLVASLRATPSGPPDGARPLGDVALLALGFLAPTAVWAAPLVAELGAARFAREVLLLDGGGVVAAYLLAFPAPGAAAALVCAGIVAAALVAARERDAIAAGLPSRRASVLAPLLVAGGVLLAGGIGVVQGSDGTGARLVAEEVCLWIGPLALVAGAVLLSRDAATARAQALLAFATVYALQLFPRPDLIHVAMGAPPVLLAIAAAWSALVPPSDPRDDVKRRAVLAWATVAAILVLCVGRAAPALRARLAEPLVSLDAGPRAPLVIAAPYAAEHRWLGEAVRAIGARTAPGDGVFYFPDLAGLGFLAERPAATFYLYFVPGRPGPAGEERTIAELERHAPRLAVTGAPRVPAFAGAEAYFARLLGRVDELYPRTEDLGAFTVRAPATAAAAACARCTGPGAG